MPKEKDSPLKVEFDTAELVVLIEARFTLAEALDIEDCIDKGLDSLREQGSAEIVSRKIIGVPRAK